MSEESSPPMSAIERLRAKRAALAAAATTPDMRETPKPENILERLRARRAAIMAEREAAPAPAPAAESESDEEKKPALKQLSSSNREAIKEVMRNAKDALYGPSAEPGVSFNDLEKKLRAYETRLIHREAMNKENHSSERGIIERLIKKAKKLSIKTKNRYTDNEEYIIPANNMEKLFK